MPVGSTPADASALCRRWHFQIANTNIRSKRPPPKAPPAAPPAIAATFGLEEGVALGRRVNEVEGISKLADAVDEVEVEPETTDAVDVVDWRVLKELVDIVEVDVEAAGGTVLKTAGKRLPDEHPSSAHGLLRQHP